MKENKKNLKDKFKKNEEETNQKYENELTKHKSITEDHKNAIQASLKTHEIEQIQNEMKEMKNLLFDEKEFKYQKNLRESCISSLKKQMETSLTMKR